MNNPYQAPKAADTTRPRGVVRSLLTVVGIMAAILAFLAIYNVFTDAPPESSSPALSAPR